jgi:hypothetical protein
MITVWNLLEGILSALVTGVGATWFAKRAIDHALTRALADRRAAFELSILERQQAFTRELQAQTQAAQQSLEGFKAQLTLGAEIRRQVASRKIDVLEKAIALGMSAVRLVGEEAQRPQFWREVNALGTVLHGAKHLFSAEVAKKLIAYYTNILTFEHDVTHDFKAELFKKMTADTESLIALARSELYVEGFDTTAQPEGAK